MSEQQISKVDKTKGEIAKEDILNILPFTEENAKSSKQVFARLKLDISETYVSTILKRLYEKGSITRKKKKYGSGAVFAYWIKSSRSSPATEKYVRAKKIKMKEDKLPRPSELSIDTIKAVFSADETWLTPKQILAKLGYTEHFYSLTDFNALCDKVTNILHGNHILCTFQASTTEQNTPSQNVVYHFSPGRLPKPTGNISNQTTVKNEHKAVVDKFAELGYQITPTATELLLPHIPLLFGETDCGRVLNLIGGGARTNNFVILPEHIENFLKQEKQEKQKLEKLCPHEDMFSDNPPLLYAREVLMDNPNSWLSEEEIRDKMVKMLGGELEKGMMPLYLVPLTQCHDIECDFNNVHSVSYRYLPVQDKNQSEEGDKGKTPKSEKGDIGNVVTTDRDAAVVRLFGINTTCGGALIRTYSGEANALVVWDVTTARNIFTTTFVELNDLEKYRNSYGYYVFPIDNEYGSGIIKLNANPLRELFEFPTLVESLGEGDKETLKKICPGHNMLSDGPPLIYARTVLINNPDQWMSAEEIRIEMMDILTTEDEENEGIDFMDGLHSYLAPLKVCCDIENDGDKYRFSYRPPIQVDGLEAIDDRLKRAGELHGINEELREAIKNQDELIGNQIKEIEQLNRKLEQKRTDFGYDIERLEKELEQKEGQIIELKKEKMDFDSIKIEERIQKDISESRKSLEKTFKG